MSTNYIKYNLLRCKSSYLQQTINFYTGVCGMKYERKTVTREGPYSWSDNDIHIFKYDEREGNILTALCFLVDNNFKTDYQNSGYWKIGLSLNDVNSAIESFRSHHVHVHPGQQFYDVGFLTSLCDPNGYSIELLQHDFLENFIKPLNNKGTLSQPIESPPSIGQITIRCTDIQKTKDFYVNVLGMKLMCVEQPANSFPFTLYFFAYTDDEPPSHDLTDIKNREWLYKKSYCQIEVQHCHKLPKDFAYITNDCDNLKIGHVGFSVYVIPALFNRIKSHENVLKISESKSKNELFIKDPDGYILHITN